MNNLFYQFNPYTKKVAPYPSERLVRAKGRHGASAPEGNRMKRYVKVLATAVTCLSFLMIGWAEDKPARQEMTKTVQMEITPQEYSYLHYDAASGRLSLHNSEQLAPLPDTVTKAIATAPEWLREPLAKRFRELIKDYVWTTNNAALATTDVNKDGITDLVIGGTDGLLKLYLGPDWKLDERNTFRHISVEADSTPAFGDVNGDNIADLVIGAKNGILVAYAGPKFTETIASFPYFKADAPTQPVFIDINNDGNKDIVVYANDKLYALFAPGFKPDSTILSKIPAAEESRISAIDIDEDNKDELVICDKEGRIKAYDAASGIKSGWWETNRYNQAMNFVMLDADADGDRDIICGRANGMVKYYPNNNGFKVFNQKPRLLLPTEAGMGAIPTFIDFDKDNKPNLLIANSDGTLHLFRGPDWKEDAADIPMLPENSVPATVDINGDGKTDIVIGSKGEALKCFLESDTTPTPANDIFSKIEDLPKYSAPAFIDIDKDNDLDLLVGGEDGRIALYINSGTAKQPQFVGKPSYLTVALKPDAPKDAKPEPLKISGASVPRVADVNNDNNPDLIIGGKDGRVSVFLGPDWKQDTTLAESVYSGSYCAPAMADLNNDGLPELVVTNANGELTYYEITNNGNNTRWEEKYSWNPNPESDAAIHKIYNYCYSETEFLRGPDDRKSVDAIAKVLQETTDPQKDEVAFAIANLPTEVLRAMARLEQADILKENARMIYDVAAKVKYVRIKEKDNYTTLEYAEWKEAAPSEGKRKSETSQEIAWTELPKDIYYWWVVHPRILYEIPCRIDGSWLEKTHGDYGITQDDWWRHQEDWYVLTNQSRFWRMAMPYDRSQDTPLIERMQRARTLQEAINQLHTWSSPQAPNPFITFGYLSDDLQPWIIYKRRYGSCGEQSIVTAALGRAMLIPTASVFTRGEDHQWNEYYMDDEWHFWDVCGNAYQCVNLPWREGYAHTGGQQSAIMRYWGNDRFDYTTATVSNPKGSKYTNAGRGYTDVGFLTIRVLDCDGRPIEGAFINIRRPGAVDMMSALGYTDLNGECKLELGKVAPGFNIAVATPYGSAGTRNYYVEEGKSYTVEYRLMGKKETRCPIGGQMPPAEAGRWMAASAKPEQQKSLTLTIDKLSALINPPARFARTRWTDTMKVLQKLNYRGSITAQYNLKNGAIILLVLDKDNFEIYKSQPQGAKALDIKPNPSTATYQLADKDLYFVLCNKQTQYATEKIALTYKYNTPLATPRITVNPIDKNEIITGDDLLIKGTSSDNAGIKMLELSLDAGKTFHNISFYLDDNTGNWAVSLQKFIGGPVPDGKYSLVFRATNYGNISTQTTPMPLIVKPTKLFTNQPIKQDNPDSPLPVCSWMLGPFVLSPTNERFVDIKTTCSFEGTDIDLFLFRDKNSDGKINGMDEKETASTSPSADERITIADVITGTYWIYAQGWKVEADNARFNINLSFYPQPEVIGGKAPNGVINNVQPEITARLASLSDFDANKVLFRMDGKEIGSGWAMTRTSTNYVTFSYPAPAPMVDGSKHTVELTVTDYLGNSAKDSWEFQVDTAPPQITYVKAKNEKPGTITLNTEAKDNAALKSVTYKLDKLSGTLNLTRKEKDISYYEGKINTLALTDEEYELVITAVDNAGNKSEEKRMATVQNPPARIFYAFPSDKETVHTPRPLIMASYKGEGSIKTKDIRIWLDDKEITADCLITADTLHYQVLGELAVGKHSLRITLKDAQGNKATHESTFEVQLEPKK